MCQMLVKFSGVEFERTASKFKKKEKENFCVLFTYSTKRAGEIRTFHVAVVQRRLRNVQKSVMHVQRFFFANFNPLFFCHSRPSSLLNPLKVMLHETIRNDNFYLNATWQHCCDIFSKRYNIRTIYTRKNKTRLTFKARTFRIRRVLF